MLVIMTGPQATDKPHTAPQDIAKRLQTKGVRAYAVGVGAKASAKDTLGIAYRADYATKVDYRNLNAAAAYLAPAFVKGDYSY
jgi:hypothetical protein